MSEFKKISPMNTPAVKTETPVMTTKNVINQEVRVVSQASVDEYAEGFIKTATQEEAEAAFKQNSSDIIPDDFMHESIVAVSKSIMSQLDIKPKDPTVSFRWVNHKGNEGSQYFNHQNWGFTNALPEDTDGNWDKRKIKTQDGAMVFGDLTLMKISKRLLYGYYKKNVLDADRTVGRKNVQLKGLEEARRQLRQDTSGIPASVVNEKLGFYIPDKVPGE